MHKFLGIFDFTVLKGIVVGFKTEPGLRGNDNPVVFIEHKLLYKTKGEVPEELYEIPLGKADVKREGKDLTIIALVGKFGFGKVVAVGEYLLDEAKNMAEVAFSVIKPYQGKGLGSLFITKLATQARENGIIGLMAYTSPQNQGMIRLFKTLPYQIESFFDGEMLTLSCRFDKPKE